MVSLSPHKDPPTPSPADCKSRHSIPRKPESRGCDDSPSGSHSLGVPGVSWGWLPTGPCQARGGLTLPSNCSSSSSSLSLPPRAPRHLETTLEFLLEISISTIRHLFLPLYFYPPHLLSDGAHPSFTTEARVPCGPCEHISQKSSMEPRC